VLVVFHQGILVERLLTGTSVLDERVLDAGCPDKGFGVGSDPHRW
jgi:hypothetical protein